MLGAAVEPMLLWLLELAADAAGRADIGRRTLNGTVNALGNGAEGRRRLPRPSTTGPRTPVTRTRMLRPESSPRSRESAPARRSAGPVAGLRGHRGILPAHGAEHRTRQLARLQPERRQISRHRPKAVYVSVGALGTNAGAVNQFAGPKTNFPPTLDTAYSQLGAGPHTTAPA